MHNTKFFFFSREIIKNNSLFALCVFRTNQWIQAVSATVSTRESEYMESFHFGRKNMKLKHTQSHHRKLHEFSVFQKSRWIFEKKPINERFSRILIKNDPKVACKKSPSAEIQVEIHSITKNICTQKKSSHIHETRHECSLARDMQMIKILTPTRQG